MQRKTALLLSGVITAFLMVILIGLAGAAGWFNQQTVAAAALPTVTTADPVTALNVTATYTTTNTANAQVAQLQSQLAVYKQQLTKAYSDLQAAYNQIQSLNQQIQAANANQSSGGFGGFGEGSGGRRFRGGGQPNLGQPGGSFFQGGGDD